MRALIVSLALLVGGIAQAQFNFPTAPTTAAAGSSPFVIGTNLSLSASGLTGVRTFTWPDASDTVVTLASTQSLSNKTFTGTTTIATANITTVQTNAFQRLVGGNVTLFNQAANFSVITGTANTSSFSFAVTPSAAASGTQGSLQVVSPASTGQAASTEINAVQFNLSATRQWATGAIPTQREFLIQAPTYSFVGASAITTAATVDITGAPIAGTNATISNAYALRIEAGALNMGGATFASLGTPQNGTFIYCSDCTIAATCAGGGTGALAKRLNSVWVCN